MAASVETPGKLRAASAADPGIVIIGAGLAGLFTALRLAPVPVTVVCAAPIGTGASSAWAQGGIAAAIGDGDMPDKHAADTVAAGAGLVDPEIALLTAGEAGDRIDDLLQYGVPFDRDIEGKLKLSREAAHGERRIVRVQGDGAGRAIMAALIDAVRKTPSIRLIEGFEAKQFLMGDAGISHVRMWPTGYSGDDACVDLSARAVVLATGGIGQIYKVTTNPTAARGEGFAMAYEAGAQVRDPEFVQFHPTAIDVGVDPAPLATEALRGEGAHLVNRRGERFMVRIDDAAELAPRDIVARAVHRELVSGRGAFLDARDAVGGGFPERFPTVHAKCIEAGLDPVTERIPIAPAAHYHMGGVRTNSCGQTSIDNLWACGEVASTGLHGANRLASNSLLEAVVFADRIAKDVHGADLPAVPEDARFTQSDVMTRTNPSLADTHALMKLRAAMSQHVGVERSKDGLLQALTTICEFQERKVQDRTLHNMLVLAECVTRAALSREESRGAHFRMDFPQHVEALRHSTLMAKGEPVRMQVADEIPVQAIAK